jgi:hypothetical protein
MYLDVSSLQRLDVRVDCLRSNSKVLGDSGSEEGWCRRCSAPDWRGSRRVAGARASRGWCCEGESSKKVRPSLRSLPFGHVSAKIASSACIHLHRRVAPCWALTFCPRVYPRLRRLSSMPLSRGMCAFCYVGVSEVAASAVVREKASCRVSWWRVGVQKWRNDGGALPGIEPHRSQ